MISANLAKHHATSGTLQLIENLLKKIGHEPSGARRESSRSRVVLSNQGAQIAAQGGEIVFPGKNARAKRKFRILAADSVFEESAHARHHLEVAHHGSRDAFADEIGLANKRLHHIEELGF